MLYPKDNWQSGNNLITICQYVNYTVEDDRKLGIF